MRSSNKNLIGGAHGGSTPAADTATGLRRSALGRTAGPTRIGILALTAASVAVVLTGCSGGSHTKAASAPAVTSPASSSSAVTAPASSSSAAKPAASATPSATARTSASSEASKQSVPSPVTVPSRSITTKAPIPTTETASFDNKVTAVVTGLKAVTATAQGPGEISGAGFAVTLKITNASGKAINLASVTVNLQDAAGTPGSPMTASPANPFTGQLANGASASGTYVFSKPVGNVAPEQVSLSYTTEAPVVVFAGHAS